MGREPDGSLKFYDDYSNADGPGYHNEEWYVPAKYLKPGKCYWSRSYTDPYSGQPMVTCTVAVFDRDRFTGAATIDLKLEGLDEMLSEHTESSGGYAFVADQHNRFISYPNADWISDKESGDRVTLDAFANVRAEFAPISQALEAVSVEHVKLASASHGFDPDISTELSRASYQISSTEANAVAMALNDPRGNEQEPSRLARLELSSDLILNEAVTVSIYHVPDSYWKVVVTPKRIVLSSVQSSIKRVWLTLLVPLVVIMAIAFWGLKYSILVPIKRMTLSLKKSTESDNLSFIPLDQDRDDELGRLAFWYNKKSIDLEQALKKLSELNVELNLHAHYDPLTGLSNRRDFERVLKSLIENESWQFHGLLYVDLDQFKLINDTCGHIAGDKLLIQVGALLKEFVRESDLVARIGGDEFAIIVRALDRGAVCTLADRIVKEAEAVSFRWEGARFNASCSIGVLHLADVERDFTVAMKLVDTACYAAKEAGRNRYHLFHQDEVANLRTAEMSWISRINQALDNNKFENEFQVIAPTSIDAGGKCCIESLVRMVGEKGQLIPPGAFMPAAERYNVVSRIDRWVIRNTLAKIEHIPNIWEQVEFVSINLSGDSICSEGFFEFVEEAIGENDILPERICFEITETQVISHLEKASHCLQKISELGCLIALDDFGSGMSSYGYLEELPVNYLKIDGSFVKDLCENNVHRAFVESMGNIAKAMHIHTIAEFVENVETYDALGEIGINYAQGYGIAKPMTLIKAISAIESHDWLVDHNAKTY